MHILNKDQNNDYKNQNHEKSLNGSNLKSIDELILIDRNVDMVTALLSQMTYEGMLDETLGISCGKNKKESN